MAFNKHGVILPSLKSSKEDLVSKTRRDKANKLFWPGTEGGNDGPLFLTNNATTHAVGDFLFGVCGSGKFYEDPAGEEATHRNIVLNEMAYGPRRKRQNQNHLPRVYALASTEDTYGERDPPMREGDRSNRVARIPVPHRVGHFTPIRELAQLPSKEGLPCGVMNFRKVKIVEQLVQLEMNGLEPPEEVGVMTVLVVPSMPVSDDRKRTRCIHPTGEGVTWTEGHGSDAGSLPGQEMSTWKFAVGKHLGRYQVTDFRMTPLTTHLRPGEDLLVRLVCASRIEVKTFFCGLAIREEYFERKAWNPLTACLPKKMQKNNGSRLRKLGECFFFQSSQVTHGDVHFEQVGMHRVWGVEARLKVPTRMHARHTCISVGESWAMSLPDPDVRPEEWGMEPRVIKHRSLVVYGEAKGTGARLVMELNSKGWL